MTVAGLARKMGGSRRTGHCSPKRVSLAVLCLAVVITCLNIHNFHSKVFVDNPYSPAGTAASSLSPEQLDRPGLITDRVSTTQTNRTGGADGRLLLPEAPAHIPGNETFFFPSYSKETDFRMNDAFSASWWQSTRNFLRYEAVQNRTVSCEDASFEVFEINEGKVRVTRDWMDLNVEHMSKWWKVLLDERNKDITRDHGRVLQIFEDYVYSPNRAFLWDSLDGSVGGTGDWLEVSQATIAVVTFMPSKGPDGGDAITKWSLAATLMSLVQLGVGRIVLSGNQTDETGERYLQEAWQEVVNATKDWKTAGPKQMPSVGFCDCGDARAGTWAGLNIPKAALRRLRHVVLSKEAPGDLRRCWAGSGSSMARWRYVFLGEPDLILNARPSVLATLAAALKDGGVLAPHRLQPLPHAADFGPRNLTKSLTFLVPNLPPHFDNITGIDHYRTREGAGASMSCCDGGNAKPGKELGNCGTFWWQCGFSFFNRWKKRSGALALVNGTLVSEAHQRVVPYPLARLTRGTGVVFAGTAMARRCFPSRGACAAPARRAG